MTYFRECTIVIIIFPIHIPICYIFLTTFLKIAIDYKYCMISLFHIRVYLNAFILSFIQTIIHD